MGTTEITAERLNELKTGASKILENVRRSLNDRHPFVGAISMSLNIIPVRDYRCETASTDGKSVFFDIDFLSRLSDAEREFVLAHEVWHNVMMHFFRTGGRNRNLFNIATDMEVNQILVNDGFTAPKAAILPKDCNFNPDLCAEEYYDLLMRQAGKRPEDGLQGKDEGQSNDKGNGNGQNGNQNGKQFDKHIYEDDNVNEQGGDGRTDRYGKVGKDKDFNPQMRKEDVERIREAVVAAATAMERTRGDIPDYVKKLVEGLLKPQISWKELIAAQITSALCDRTNWNLPNRRFAYSGTYLPSHCGEKIRIAVGVDTSGSCSQDWTKFISEINNIAKTFGNYEIHMIQCDTEVKKYDLFDESNPMDFEYNPIEFCGNGGTILQPIFDYINLNDLDVDTIVMFTDAECETFAETSAPDARVIWAITGGSKGGNLEFGEKIFLQD